MPIGHYVRPFRSYGESGGSRGGVYLAQLKLKTLRA